MTGSQGKIASSWLSTVGSYMTRWHCLEMRWLLPMLIVTVTLCSGIPAAGQTTYSRIVGTVTDPTDAAVPEAAITVTNESTNVKSTTSSDTHGNYLVDKLIPGVYTVSVEKQGFNRHVNSGLTLLAEQSLRVNTGLTVGAVSTEITVTGQVSVLETEKGEIGFARTARELEVLPVITPALGLGSASFATRDPLNYVFSMPGAEVSRTASAGKITANGANQGSTIVRVDGTSTRDNSNGIGYGGRPMLEATGELKVIAINAPAEFDGQATILLSTRSGGNAIHGGAFYEGQQGALNAQFWELTTQPKPFTRRNSVGAWVGGPVKRDRTFYFIAWEAERTRRGLTLNRTLPLPAFMTGDFSQLIDPTFVDQYLGGRPVVIRDPLNNNAPFPGNIIPEDRINSVSKMIQADIITGQPSLPGLSVNAPIGKTVPVHTDKIDARIDHNFTQAHRMFGHFNIGRYSEDAYASTWDQSNYLARYPSKQFSVSDTYSFGPNVLNEFRFGHYRYHYDLLGYLKKSGREYQKEWGIVGIGETALIPIISGLPFQVHSQPPAIWFSKSYEAMDNLSIVKGRHNIKVGYTLNRPSFPFYYLAGYEGRWNFSNTYTRYTYADFLLGYPTTSTLEFPPPAPGIVVRSWEHNWYVQDTYQVSPRLTLDYGIRYEYHPRASAVNDLIANFDPVTQGIVVPSETSLKYVSEEFPTNVPVTTADKANFPRNMVKNDVNDVAPRLSFAYRLDEKGNTVLRGGYGIYFNSYVLNMSSTLGNFGIYRGSQVSKNFLIPGTTIPELVLPHIYREWAPGTGNVSYTADDKNLPDAQFHQWNLTLERAFGGNRLVVSYIGNYGTHAIGRDLNQPKASTTPFSASSRPIPNFDKITWYTNDNILRYNTLQVVAERRFKRGLFFRASYNWTKNLTRADNDTGPVGGTTVENSYALAAEKGDIAWSPRQRFVVVYSYELPIGPEKPIKARGVLGQVVGGWQINGITNLRTGLRFNPTYSGYDASGTGLTSGRPDRIANGNLPSDQRTPQKWFDVSAFTCPGQVGQVCAAGPPIGRFGTAGRNILEGPGATDFDFSLQKNFPIREAMRLQIQVQFVNLFNTPQLELPAANISDPGSVGQIRSTIAGTNRQVQFGARFEF